MFTEAEFKDFMVPAIFGSNYVQIECGCTLRRFGDSRGQFRAFVDGKIEIDCQCHPSCSKVNLSPVQFARHIGKNSTVDSWKNHLWVMDKDGNRIKLADTDILRFHVQTFDRPLRPFVHRDEFICCTRCNKQRRFLLRTREQCRVYHRASLKTEWICADNGMRCEDAEERKSRMPLRGCPNKPKCKGCICCVCTGCRTCRFEDCDCQICIDYVKNEWHADPNN
ncbi:hypothetical protein M9H77_00993 [Catharanthus roseus]|uniref:Uncharacterized protein n=1 Tax=Catharanthus roseus TaxID=4058 RepID=A0ACC0C4Q3_CATRO|nr:hypothetical protein M9H77_00993 [Catharanthus roseus]